MSMWYFSVSLSVRNISVDVDGDGGGCDVRDGANYAVVHCTGYIKNWPPQGIQMERSQEEEMHASSSCCLVAIGRLQVSSSP